MSSGLCTRGTAGSESAGSSRPARRRSSVRLRSSLLVAVDVVEHDRAHGDLSFAKRFHRGERVRQHAECVARNQHGLQIEQRAEVCDRVFAIDRNQHPADAFDDRVVGVARQARERASPAREANQRADLRASRSRTAQAVPWRGTDPPRLPATRRRTRARVRARRWGLDRRRFRSV